MQFISSFLHLKQCFTSFLVGKPLKTCEVAFSISLWFSCVSIFASTPAYCYAYIEYREKYINLSFWVFYLLVITLFSLLRDISREVFTYHRLGHTRREPQYKNIINISIKLTMSGLVGNLLVRWYGS